MHRTPLTSPGSPSLIFNVHNHWPWQTGSQALPLVSLAVLHPWEHQDWKGQGEHSVCWYNQIHRLLSKNGPRAPTFNKVPRSNCQPQSFLGLLSLSWPQLNLLYQNPPHKRIHDDNQERESIFVRTNHHRFLAMCICVSFTPFPILAFFSFF